MQPVRGSRILCAHMQFLFLQPLPSPTQHYIHLQVFIENKFWDENVCVCVCVCVCVFQTNLKSTYL